MNAAEHFDWAVGRAMEYVERGDGATAHASLTSDLAKHKGTEGILPGLQMLFIGELMLDGAEGVRRFIEALPRPADTELVSPASGQAAYDAAFYDDVPPNAGSAS